MFELAKVYKTKAMAINAIRMTATNRGWKVLSTDDAAAYVYPGQAGEGFVVANAELNVAMGFAAPEVEQKVPAGSITDGKALEAVSAALAEQAPKDKAAPKLQAPSKLEESKKANKKQAKNKPADVDPLVFPGTKQTRCNVANGARRPLRGKTLLVWETTERMQAASGEVPSLKQVHEELCKTEPGFNKTTAGIQYYACRTYNGWSK